MKLGKRMSTFVRKAVHLVTSSHVHAIIFSTSSSSPMAFHERLHLHPLYPFHEVEGHVADEQCLRHERHHDSLISGVVLILASAVILLLAFAQPRIILSTPYLVYGVLLMLPSGMFTIAHSPVRRWQLHLAKGTYTFTVGTWGVLKGLRHDVYEGKLHNIFVRAYELHPPARGGVRPAQCALCIAGVGMDWIPLPCHGPLADVRELGQELAERLRINYFDVDNRSQHHVIRHSPQADEHKPPTGMEAAAASTAMFRRPKGLSVSLSAANGSSNFGAAVRQS